MTQSAPATTNQHPDSYQRNGVLIGLSAFLMWGVLPLYLKLLSDIIPFEVLAHRVAWSVVCLFAVMLITRKSGALKAVLKNWKSLRILFITATIIAVNWIVYIHAVSSNQALEGSMGYFINPLFSVLFGFLFLKETMTPRQWLAVACAAVGVAFMVVNLGHFPIIALTLAISFATYGLLRKTIPVDGATGLLVESMVLAPFAIAYLIWLETQGTGHFGHNGLYWDMMLIVAGPITAVPLSLFGIAVQRVRLATIGLMQYIAPSTQFFIAVWVFHEPFTTSHMWTFAFIWTGLVIYSTPQALLNRVGLRIR